MAQYFTDFSEYNIGDVPSGFINRLSDYFDKSVVSFNGQNHLELTGNTQYSNEYGGYCFDAPTSQDNIEVVAQINDTDSFPGVLLGGGLGGYAYRTNGYIVSVDGADNKFDSVIGNHSATFPGWFRLRKSGNNIKAKNWGNAESEPSGWSLETTDSSYSVDLGGVYSITNPTDYCKFNVVGVGTDGDTAPTAPVVSSNPPTAPTGLTLTEL